MYDNHNRSCLCSTCSYRSVLEIPSLRRIITQESKVDKLYSRQFIPHPMEKNLMKKIVTPRTKYNHFRKEEFKREANLPENVLATSTKEHVKNKKLFADSNSVVLDFSLNNKDKTIKSRISIDICTCCSCNSSIIAREAGTRYIRDSVSGKKMYKISKARKKNIRNFGSPKAEIMRSKPTTKSTPSSSVDGAIKVKSSVNPLNIRQYQSGIEGFKYSYDTMGEGNLLRVDTKDVPKPLIIENRITSGGDKLHTKETKADELNNGLIENNLSSKHTLKRCFCTLKFAKCSTIAKDGLKLSQITKDLSPSVNDILHTKQIGNESKSSCTKDKRANKRTFKKSFCTLKYLKEINAKPNLPKTALKYLPEKENYFPRSTNLKKTLKLKPSHIKHRSVKWTPKSNKFQKKYKKIISKESIARYCATKRNICCLNTTNISPKPDKTTFRSCFDTYYMENKMPSGKTLSYPKRESVLFTEYGNVISEKSFNSITNQQKPRSRIDKVTQPKENWYSSLENCRTNFQIPIISPKQKSDKSILTDQQIEASNLVLQNSCLAINRRKCFKFTINHCFCKLARYGKDKNIEKNINDNIVQSLSDKNSSVQSKKQQDKERKPKYKEFFKRLGRYKKKETYLGLATSSTPEKSDPSMSYNSSVDYRIGMEMHEVKRRCGIQPIRCLGFRELIKESKVPFSNSTSSICITYSCQDIKSSSSSSFKSKDKNTSKNSRSIVQYEWKPMYTVSRTQTDIIKHAKEVEDVKVDLRRCSCRLLRKKNRIPHLSIVNTEDIGNVRKPVFLPYVTPYSFHCQSIKDMQYFEQLSSNSKDTWQQTIWQNPLMKHASIKSQVSNSFTETDSYRACLGHHKSKKRLDRSEVNYFANTKRSSGTETDLRSTMPSYHRLKQFCVMNMNIDEPKIKLQKLKVLECAPNKCNELSCLTLLHRRLQNQTSTMTSSPISQQNQACTHCDLARMSTLSQTPSSPESCCVQAKPPKQKREPKKKAPKKKTSWLPKQNTYEYVGLSCKRPLVKTTGMRDPGKGTEIMEPSTTTKGLVSGSINPDKDTMKTTATEVKEPFGQSMAVQSEESEQIAYPCSHSKRKRLCRIKKCVDSTSTSNNFPGSVTDSLNTKALANGILRSKKRRSFTTVTVSGLISVCKKPKGIVTQNSTCSFHSPYSVTPTLTKTATAGTRTKKSKHLQKGTDPLCSPYPSRKDIGAMTCKVKPEGVKIKIRERGVGTPRRQLKTISSTTEPCQPKNRQCTGKRPRESRCLKSKIGRKEPAESRHSYNLIFSTNKVGRQNSIIRRTGRFGNQVIPTTDSATSLKRCFCTTALIKTGNQKVYCMPFITIPNQICDNQKDCLEVASLPKSELDVKQMNHEYECYAPYEFLPIECDPGEYIERVIKRKQYKKIKHSDIINSAQCKTNTCKHYAHLLTSYNDKLPSDTKWGQLNKINKEVTSNISYTYHSTESSQDKSLLDDNIGTAKSNYDLRNNLTSDTSQKFLTDSIGMTCDTGDLTGMSQHLNKHVYALRLETSQKNTRSGSKKGKAHRVKDNRSQVLLPNQCKASNCALGNYNPKVCDKVMKDLLGRVGRGESDPVDCDPVDCARSKFNQKIAERRNTVGAPSPYECAPGDCEPNKCNQKQCERRILMRVSPPMNAACQAVKLSKGAKISKKPGKKPKVKTKPVITSQNIERFEPKRPQLSHVVEDRRFKNLRYPFDSGVTITSSISLDIEFYRQERLPSPKRIKPVCVNDVKPCKKPKKKIPKPKPCTSNRSVSIQAKCPETVNIIKKCFCTLMRRTKDKKICAKQMIATCAEIGVSTEMKLLEPTVFYPADKICKQKKTTKNFCCGTDICRRTFSTMTDNKTCKNQTNEVSQICKYNQTSDKCSSAMTTKIKLRKADQNVALEKPIEVKKRRILHTCYSDFNITSKISFDVEVSRYEKLLKHDSEKSSAKTMPIACTPKDKPSRKVAATKLPSKSSSETVVKTKNKSQSTAVHPSLKRCFCTMKLQNQQEPYAREETVNFMTKTITSLNISKYRLLKLEKSPNTSIYSNIYFIHEKPTEYSSGRYSRSKIFNEFLNRFASSYLSKLFRKSFDFRRALTKPQLMQVPDSYQNDTNDSNQTAFSNEMITIYAYNSHKFNNYTSRTMIRHRCIRSKFRRYAKKHNHHHNDLNTKKRRKKRRHITETVDKDLIKQPNKENNILSKVKNTFKSILKAFKRIKHKDSFDRDNFKSKNNIELNKRNKIVTVTAKADTLKTSKSDREKCYVVNNVDPLKTSKSDRQPVNPKQIINQKKSKRVKVSSPRAFTIDKNNTRHSKCMEQGRKKYCCFQSGDIEIRPKRKKDLLHKRNKHYNNYTATKRIDGNSSVQKHRIQVTMKHKKKKRRSNKYDTVCCKDIDKWIDGKKLYRTRKMKIKISKKHKARMLKNEERVKVRKRKSDKHMKNANALSCCPNE